MVNKLEVTNRPAPVKSDLSVHPIGVRVGLIGIQHGDQAILPQDKSKFGHQRAGISFFPFISRSVYGIYPSVSW